MKSYTITMPFTNNSLVNYDKLIESNVFFTHKGELINFAKGSVYSIDFYNPETDQRFWDYKDEDIKINVVVEVKENKNINYNFVDNDEVMTKKYSDFDYGIYCVILFDTQTYKLEHELFTCHKNITTMGGCFGSEVFNKKKILAYVKVEEFEDGE